MTASSVSVGVLVGTSGVGVVAVVESVESVGGAPVAASDGVVPCGVASCRVANGVEEGVGETDSAGSVGVARRVDVALSVGNGTEMEPTVAVADGVGVGVLVCVNPGVLADTSAVPGCRNADAEADSFGKMGRLLP